MGFGSGFVQRPRPEEYLRDCVNKFCWTSLAAGMVQDPALATLLDWHQKHQPKDQRDHDLNNLGFLEAHQKALSKSTQPPGLPVVPLPSDETELASQLHKLLDALHGARDTSLSEVEKGMVKHELQKGLGTFDKLLEVHEGTLRGLEEKLNELNSGGFGVFVSNLEEQKERDPRMAAQWGEIYAAHQRYKHKELEMRGLTPRQISTEFNRTRYNYLAPASVEQAIDDTQMDIEYLSQTIGVLEKMRNQFKSIVIDQVCSPSRAR